ncbi:RNA polymerase I-specific transcription initiation factor rrn5 [Paramyrothecium foliicola]|nr:RNA polymerase I-specific transcription initiation factor rrn5 [Paramyrothecium foliicola]
MNMSSDAEYSLDAGESSDEAQRTSRAAQASPLLGDFVSRPSSRESASGSDEPYGYSLGEVDTARSSPLKRPAEEDAVILPAFKRQKGLLNPGYLDLLNVDIEDAAQRLCTEDDNELPPSQIGLTQWSSMEKRLFFEALARLGKHNLAAIAARIGTKSVVEVNHYISLLDENHVSRRKTDHRPIINLSGYPAAVELSQRCCHAQEEVADVISLRQERREQQREQAKWGGGNRWDVNSNLARRLDKGERMGDDKDLAFMQLFHLSRFLQLSERIFMNSSIPSNNWRFVDDTPPSVWTTTFEDIYSLIVSITRRLVQTTLFISMSRIRAKSELIPGTKKVVHRKDVEAAVASLGMTLNSRRFWQESARRLRLDVYDSSFTTTEEDEETPLSYEDVEAALAEDDDAEVDVVSDTSATGKDVDSDEEPLKDESGESGAISDGTGQNSPVMLSEQDEIEQEANEILVYSAADFPETTRAKEALERRIIMERQQEQHADMCDEYASQKAEAEMWELLQKPPPVPMLKVQDPGPAPLSNLDVESVYGLGRNWRANTRYYSEWETRPDSSD